MFAQTKRFARGARRVTCLLLSVLLAAAVAGNGLWVHSETEAVPESQYFARNALAGVTGGAKLLYIYNQVAAGIARSAATVDLSDSRYNISVADLEAALNAYLGDYPQHFWLAKAYQYQHINGRVVGYVPQYQFTGAALTAAKTAFEKRVNELLAGIPADADDYEKEKLLHDRLCEAITYAEANNAHDAYGALVNGVAVCEGYAKALQYLLYRVGVMSFLVTGTAAAPTTGEPEAHAWNLVRVNGRYYHTDLTWDDQSSDVFHAYFNLTTQLICEDHTIDATPYALPDCTDLTDNYFKREGGWIESLSADELKAALSRNGLRAHLFLGGETDNFIDELNGCISRVATDLNMIFDGLTRSVINLGRERMVMINGTRRGDVNGDNYVDLADVQRIYEHLHGSRTLAGIALKAADADGNGACSDADVTALLTRLTTDPLTGPNAREATAAGKATLQLVPRQATVETTGETAQVTFDVYVQANAPGVCVLDVTLTANGLQNLQIVATNEGRAIFGAITADADTGRLLLLGSDPAGDRLLQGRVPVAVITADAPVNDAPTPYAFSVRVDYVSFDSDPGCRYAGLTAVESGSVSVMKAGDTSTTSSPSDPTPSETPSQTPSDTPSQTSSDTPSQTPSVTPPAPSDVSSGADDSQPGQTLNLADPNNDGLVNAADALLVLRAAVGKATLTEEQIRVSDLNRDGNVNAADALIILRIAVGKQELPAI